MISAYKLPAFNSVHVLLESADSIRVLADGLQTTTTVIADVRSEPEYLASASQSMNRMLRVVAYAIGTIMAIGAFCGALNTMYSAVAARGTEIATLRALGFSASVIFASLLVEALLLALVGASIGIAIAYFAFDGKTISTLGGAVWDSQLVYSLTLTPALVITALGLASAIGFLGGLLPALRVARSSIAGTLRAA